MKNTFIKILVVAILFFGGVYYTHTPKFMLMRLADTASKSGDVSGYLTGDMKKAMKNVKKTESVLNLFTGDVSNEKFMNFIVQYLYTIEWNLNPLNRTAITVLWKWILSMTELLTLTELLNLNWKKRYRMTRLKR